MLKKEKGKMMANKRKVDFSLASEIFEDASLTDSFPEKNNIKSVVPISKLVTNPYQPRIEIIQESIVELANSIVQNGLLQPITVLINSDETFTIVFGHRRVAAYAYLNRNEIEANILTTLENKALVIAPIVENLQRKDMEPVETAMALNRVLKMGIVKTQSDLSAALGISQGRISKLMSVLKLSDELLTKIRKNNYKDVTVLAALNQIPKQFQLEVFNTVRILPRNDALLKIKEYLLKKDTEIKRVIHANSSIKINTKGLSKDVKERVLSYIKDIEQLLKEEKSNE